MIKHLTHHDAKPSLSISDLFNYYLRVSYQYCLWFYTHYQYYKMQMRQVYECNVFFLVENFIEIIYNIVRNGAKKMGWLEWVPICNPGLNSFTNLPTIVMEKEAEWSKRRLPKCLSLELPGFDPIKVFFVLKQWQQRA